jgi:protein-tyrosine phosphatase
MTERNNKAGDAPRGTRTVNGWGRGLGLAAVLATALLATALIAVAAVPQAHWVDVRGTTRFRDMGGRHAGESSVRTGVLYRSDDLSGITADGIDDLTSLGIVTVVDLRNDSQHPSSIEELSGGAIKVVRLPMIADPIRDRNDYYKRMIVNSRQSLIGLLTLLSDTDNLPLVMFDEDGINEVDVAAEFVLLTVGVSGPDVVSDYLFSNERGAALKPEWGEIIVRYFDEYGGMDYYATRILGIGQDRLARIRNNLIR